MRKTPPYPHRPGLYRPLASVGLSILSLVLLWQITVALAGFPAFILPSPLLVLQRFLRAVQEGSLLAHTGFTLLEVVLGLAIGVSIATLLGYLLARSIRIERALSPYIVASQSVPIVALAPLLIVWFGFGLLSKVLVSALTIFFPVLITTIVGLRSVEEDLMDLMRSLQSSRWQIFRYLEVPAALPVLLGGLKVGVTLSVIGAVVGEFAQSDRGLGFLVNLANRGLFDTPLMFVALFVLMTIALGLYGEVVLEGRELLVEGGIEAVLFALIGTCRRPLPDAFVFAQTGVQDKIQDTEDDQEPEQVEPPARQGIVQLLQIAIPGVVDQFRLFTNRQLAGGLALEEPHDAQYGYDGDAGDV